MLRWHSFSERGSDRITLFVAYNGWQYDGYVHWWPNWIVINLLTWPKFVDPALTVIFRMKQWLCRFVFCLYRLPIRWLCVFATKLNLNYLTYMTKICWGSVDTHFQNGAVTVSLTLLPIKASNMMVMWISDQVDLELPYLHDRKSETLLWHSFSEWGSDRVAFFLAYKGCQNVGHLCSRPNWIVITLLTWLTFFHPPLSLSLRMG